MYNTLLLLVFSLSLTGFAHAAGDTQAELNQSAHLRYQSADAALNTAYARLMSVLSPERQQQLKLAQRAWLKYRDADAEFKAGAYRGGSIQPLIYSQALIELTEYRTRQLSELYREQSAH
ncbi:lysozyme inhibitor LprI family protein [Oceanisphaera sp.]|uniref:lysozyme inhibitor LprI family protein n=1 Tax=Oceanisphaera sp. TaxID=1929979 RepID=UPI003A8CD290